jgi:hypothetical protein
MVVVPLRKTEPLMKCDTNNHVSYGGGVPVAEEFFCTVSWHPGDEEKMTDAEKKVVDAVTELINLRGQLEFQAG